MPVRIEHEAVTRKPGILRQVAVDCAECFVFTSTPEEDVRWAFRPSNGADCVLKQRRCARGLAVVIRPLDPNAAGTGKRQFVGTCIDLNEGMAGCRRG